MVLHPSEHFSGSQLLLVQLSDVESGIKLEENVADLGQLVQPLLHHLGALLVIARQRGLHMLLKRFARLCLP